MSKNYVYKYGDTGFLKDGVTPYRIICDDVKSAAHLNTPLMALLIRPADNGSIEGQSETAASFTIDGYCTYFMHGGTSWGNLTPPAVLT